MVNARVNAGSEHLVDDNDNDTGSAELVKAHSIYNKKALKSRIMKASGKLRAGRFATV